MTTDTTDDATNLLSNVLNTFASAPLKAVPEVRPVAGVFGKYKPKCDCTVRSAHWMTSTREKRERRRKREGLPIDQCGAPSTHYWIEDERTIYLCRSHAGQKALLWIIEAQN